MEPRHTSDAPAERLTEQLWRELCDAAGERSVWKALAVNEARRHAETRGGHCDCDFCYQVKLRLEGK